MKKKNVEKNDYKYNYFLLHKWALIKQHRDEMKA